MRPHKYTQKRTKSATKASVFCIQAYGIAVIKLKNQLIPLSQAPEVSMPFFTEYEHRLYKSVNRSKIAQEMGLIFRIIWSNKRENFLKMKNKIHNI